MCWQGADKAPRIGPEPGPANHPFVNVVALNGYYWSSTSNAYPARKAFAWATLLYSGFTNVRPKATPLYVWPVRGPRAAAQPLRASAESRRAPR